MWKFIKESEGLVAPGGAGPGLCPERAYLEACKQVGSSAGPGVRSMMGGRTGRLRNGKTRDIHPQFSVASHAPTLAPPLPHTLQSSHAPTPTRALPDPLMLGWRVLARTRSTSSCASSSLGERHKFTFSRLSYCTCFSTEYL